MSGSLYETYSTELIKNIPTDNLTALVKTFMDSASIDMGSDYDEAALNRVCFIIRTEFAYLPLCFIASGFSQGAMGKFGAGRLVPRTIHGWLNEIVSEWNRKSIKDRQAELEAEVYVRYDLRKYPIGKAIVQKIEWYDSGKLDGDRWDNVNLMELTEAIGNHEEIQFNRFYKE